MEQRLEKQTEEIAWAAREITEAVRELARAIDRLAELQHPKGAALFDALESGGLPEEEATRIALEVVHRVREEIGREPEAPAPTPEEIREWNARR